MSCVNFPKDFFKNEEDYLTILLNLEELEKKNRNSLIYLEKNLENNEILSPPFNCNKIFSKFLYEVSKYLKVEAYKQVAFFICLLRKTLNIIGCKLRQNEFQEPKFEFCDSNSAESILEFANEFITHYLPLLLDDHTDLDLEFIGKEDHKIKNCIFLTQYFASWLLCNNYTKVKIQLNYEEKKY